MGGEGGGAAGKRARIAREAWASSGRVCPGAVHRGIFKFLFSFCAGLFGVLQALHQFLVGLANFGLPVFRLELDALGVHLAPLFQFVGGCDAAHLFDHDAVVATGGAFRHGLNRGGRLARRRFFDVFGFSFADRCDSWGRSAARCGAGFKVLNLFWRCPLYTSDAADE